MALKDAGLEVPKLAEKHGFGATSLCTETSLIFAHQERREAFRLIVDESTAFVSANWYAETEYVTIVDKRGPGEYGKEGRSLVANTKRRSVGMDEVRPHMRTSSTGLDVGYMDLKRRIRNKDWRQS